jgi:ribosomal protein S18 acetylase RimI-like enzyme
MDEGGKRPIQFLVGCKKRFIRKIRDTTGSKKMRSWVESKERTQACSPSDLPGVIKIYHETFGSNNYDAIYRYQKLFDKIFYLVKLDEDVIAYCMYYIHYKLINAHIVPVSTLFSLAVESNHRWKGYGSVLLKESFQEMKQNGITTVYLYVDILNQEAIDFYLNQGFEIVKEVTDLSPQEKKCFKMSLDIG